MFPKLNHNVSLTILLCCFYGVADNLVNSSVFAAYLKSISGSSNAAVGYVEGANGFAQLLTALPVGYLADKYKRSTIIFYGGLGVIGAAVLNAALIVYLGDDGPTDEKQMQDSLYAFLIVTFLWGTVSGVIDGPVEALFADSTPRGQRTRYYFYLFAAETLSSCAGPVISIGFFMFKGDEWSIQSLKDIMLIGLVFELCGAGCMLFFDDSKSLVEEEGGETEEETDEEDAEVDEEDTEFYEDVDEDDVETDANKYKVSNKDKDLIRRRKQIPYLLLFFDLIIALGSGLSVGFFALFFKDDVKRSPTEVQIIYLIIPLVMVICSFFASRLAAVWGRVQTVILSKALGLSCLYIIVLAPGLIDYPGILAFFYIFQTSFMNATQPLEESILMDYVKKSERARWKSLEGVAGFGWCGSAVIGGILSDRYGYKVTFLITAVIESLGVLGYFYLIELVELESEVEVGKMKREKGKSNKKKIGWTEDDTRPLLGVEGGGGGRRYGGD